MQEQGKRDRNSANNKSGLYHGASRPRADDRHTREGSARKDRDRKPHRGADPREARNPHGTGIHNHWQSDQQFTAQEREQKTSEPGNDIVLGGAEGQVFQPCEKENDQGTEQRPEHKPAPFDLLAVLQVVQIGAKRAELDEEVFGVIGGPLGGGMPVRGGFPFGEDFLVAAGRVAAGPHDLVVAGAGNRVTEGSIGFVDRFETFLGQMLSLAVGLPDQVGVVLLGKCAVRRPDFVRGSVARKAEDVVEGHGT